MYFVSIRELFPMRSDGLGRALACILAGLIFGGIGQMLGAFLGPLLFPSLPESNVAENATAVLALALFIFCGSCGVVLCRRLTTGLPESEPKDSNVGMVTNRTRWLVIATGVVVTTTSWSGLGLYSAIFPTVLVIGALMQPHSQRHGFWLMFVPAVFLSSWMFPLGCLLLLDRVRSAPYDPKMVIVSSLWAVSLLLLACCDAALITEGFKLKLFSEAKP